METCWFCLQPLKQPGRPVDRHHRLPKRYCTTDEKRDKDNIVLSHCDCHQLHHRIYDRVRLNRDQYVRYMRSINWARGIFAHQAAMAAD